METAKHALQEPTAHKWVKHPLMDFVILDITVVVALRFLILLMTREMSAQLVDSVNMDLKQNLIAHLERTTSILKARLSKIV